MRGYHVMIDCYVYPGTNVLVNKQGITDVSRLELFERNMTALRFTKLRGLEVTGKFDVEHLKSIHKELFGDIYDWAGEFRNIQIYKGGTEFTAPSDIPDELGCLCDGIHDDNYFRGMPEQNVVSRLADVMGRLNAIHPFREGNGRTQRLFLEQLAVNAGYDLDFSNVSENDMRDASRASVRGDNRLMRYLIKTNMTETGDLGSVVRRDTRSSLLHRVFPFLSNVRGKGDSGFSI